MELLTFVFLTSVYGVVETTLVRVPENAAVAQGSEVTLDCSSDIGTAFLTWFNRSCPRYDDLNDCVRSSVIYNGFNDRDSPPRFTIASISSAINASDAAREVIRNVNIRQTQPTDAGDYVCVENIRGQGVQQTSSAQLVILDIIRCTANVSASEDVQENDVIAMTCSVTYSGNWAPVMRWFNSVTRHNFTDDDTTLTTNDTTVTSQLMFGASIGLQGSQIICVIYFTQPSTPLTTDATNVPSYTDVWTSPTLRVTSLIAPRNIQLTPAQSTYESGDRIQCSAEGIPEPSYQWTDMHSGTVIRAAVLVISDDMADKSHAFKCIASNYYNGTIHENSTTIVFSVIIAYSSSTVNTVVSNDDGKLVPIALIVVAGIAIAIIVLLVLYIIWKTSQRHGEKDHRSGHSDAATQTTNPAHGSDDACDEFNI